MLTTGRTQIESLDCHNLKVKDSTVKAPAVIYLYYWQVTKATEN